MPRRSLVVSTSFAAASVLLFASAVRAQHGAEYLNQRLSQVAAQFAAGWQLSGAVQTAKLPAKGTKTHAFAVDAGKCYRAIAVGDADVQNLDVAIKAGGAEVSRDTATDNTAVASHCPTAAGSIDVAVTVVAGRGEYSLGMYTGQGEGRAPTGPSLEGRLEAAAAAQARGYEPHGEVQRGTLTADGAQSFRVPVARGQCYRFMAVGGEGVQDVDLHAYVGGTRVGSDSGHDSNPVASYCATADGHAEVRMHMYRGGGEFVFRTFRARAEGGPVGTIPVGGGDDFVSTKMRELHAKVGQGRAAVTPLRRGRLQTSRSCTWATELQGGHCYTILSVGAPSAHDMDLTINDPSGNRVADDTEGAGAQRTATTCPPFTGPYRVNVRMTAGYGPFGVQVFGN